MFSDPLTERLAAFVRGIGIDVRAASLSEPTVLPGLDIRDGAVLIDESRLAYPGESPGRLRRRATSGSISRSSFTRAATRGRRRR